MQCVCVCVCVRACVRVRVHSGAEINYEEVLMERRSFVSVLTKYVHLTIIIT